MTSDRRAFLKTVPALAAGAWLTGGTRAAAAQTPAPARKRNPIGVSTYSFGTYQGRRRLDEIEILDIAADQRTMNFGWNIADDLDTAIHEIGHTLGFEHEHQNPFSGIVWDEEKVYAALAKPPNSWSRQKTFFNIIRKLDESRVQGTEWDPDSVMHYPFEAGLIKQPTRYQTEPLLPAGGLSARDVAYVKQQMAHWMPSALNQALNEARQAYNITHHGADTTDPMELASYFQKPEDGARYLDFISRRPLAR